jgi:hypothetical protein
MSQDSDAQRRPHTHISCMKQVTESISLGIYLLTNPSDDERRRQRLVYGVLHLELEAAGVKHVNVYR